MKKPGHRVGFFIAGCDAKLPALMGRKDLRVTRANGYIIVEKNGSWFVVNEDYEVVSLHGSYDAAVAAAEKLPPCPPKKDPPKPSGCDDGYGM
jgi:hypothetical protein